MAGGSAVKGVVEAINNKKGALKGWVLREGRESEVEIVLNGVVVATTFPSQTIAFNGGTADVGFSRVLKDLWANLGEGDVVEVKYDGQALPIVGHGTRWCGPVGVESQSAAMLKKMKKGLVFNKYGQLRKGILEDDTYKDWVFEMLPKLRAEIREAIDCEAFPIYGTMLGAVREGDFIGHDNDFDMVYVSKFTEPEEVKAEYRKLCGILIDKGYWVRSRETHIWIRRSPRHKLDIFFSWFDKDGRFHLSYGYHHEPLKRSADFDRLVPYQMAGHEVLLPAASEDILRQTFGDGWKTPDRGFSHKSSTRRMDDRYLLTERETAALYWKQFYRDNDVSEGSSFARFVAEQLPAETTVIEIGSGTGRDAVFLAEHGHTVFGSDRAAEGVKRATDAAAAKGLKTSFHVVDAADRDQLAAYVQSAPTEGARLVYMRFFLHSIPEEVQELIFDVISDLPPGFQLALEFRTDKDEAQKKVFGIHYRRFIPPSEVTESLKRRGFVIEHEESGFGLSPWQDEDPHLARILARKS